MCCSLFEIEYSLLNVKSLENKVFEFKYFFIMYFLCFDDMDKLMSTLVLEGYKIGCKIGFDIYFDKLFVFLEKL